MGLLRAVLRVDKELPAKIEAELDAVKRQRGVDWSQKLMAELHRHVQEHFDASLRFGPLSMIANSSAGVWYDLLETVLKKMVGDEARALASHLVSGSGNVVSAEHSSRLLDLAAAARNDADAQQLLNTEPLAAPQWKALPESSPFRRELERFLDEFGQRGVYEVEIANARWFDDPTFILAQVRLLLDAESPESFHTAIEVRRREAEQVIRPRTRLLWPFIRWVVRRARHGSALREAGKSALAARLEPLRAIFLETGHRMSADGVLDEPNDIFFLTWPELDAYMRAWWDGKGARALIEDRKAQHEAWQSEEPPDVILEDAESGARTNTARAVTKAGTRGAAPIASTEVQVDPSTGTDRRLRGTGVAADIATGRVRILRHPSEGHKLGKGDILVAPSTDPGWTPLFMHAAAIVTEVGGFHSHGSIVAREFGILAVANIPGLLTTVQDGEVVTVDGDAGIVIRSKPKAASR